MRSLSNFQRPTLSQHSLKKNYSRKRNLRWSCSQNWYQNRIHCFILGGFYSRENPSDFKYFIMLHWVIVHVIHKSMGQSLPGLILPFLTLLATVIFFSSNVTGCNDFYFVKWFYVVITVTCKWELPNTACHKVHSCDTVSPWLQVCGCSQVPLAATLLPHILSLSVCLWRTAAATSSFWVKWSLQWRMQSV